MKKNAISPLIATVLLIGFTVSLTAVVMVWSQGLIKKTTAEEGALADTRMDCTNLDFTVDKSCSISGNPKSLTFTIRNLQSTKIDGFTFRSTSLAGTIEKRTALSPFTTQTYDVTTAKSVTTIDIVPILKLGDKYLPCSAQAKTARITACP